MKSLKNKKGFTIVELVIVIAVIAILAAVMIPTFSNIVEKAKESAAMQEVKNAYSATLAEDMSNINNSNYSFNVYDSQNKKVMDKIVVKHTNGTYIEIKSGVASIVTTENETHELDATTGKLKKKSS